MLAGGNLFIVTLDRKKANPVYVKAFLDTPKGRALPDMAVQDAVAERYLEAEEEVARLRESISALRQGVADMIDASS